MVRKDFQLFPYLITVIPAATEFIGCLVKRTLIPLHPEFFSTLASWILTIHDVAATNISIVIHSTVRVHLDVLSSQDSNKYSCTYIRAFGVCYVLLCSNSAIIIASLEEETDDAQRVHTHHRKYIVRPMSAQKGFVGRPPNARVHKLTVSRTLYLCTGSCYIQEAHARCVDHTFAKDAGPRVLPRFSYGGSREIRNTMTGTFTSGKCFNGRTLSPWRTAPQFLKKFRRPLQKFRKCSGSINKRQVRAPVYEPHASCLKHNTSRLKEGDRVGRLLWVEVSQNCSASMCSQQDVIVTNRITLALSQMWRAPTIDMQTKKARRFNLLLFKNRAVSFP